MLFSLHFIAYSIIECALVFRFNKVCDALREHLPTYIHMPRNERRSIQNRARAVGRRGRAQVRLGLRRQRHEMERELQ